MKVSQNTDSFFCICDKSGSTVHLFFIGDMLESGWQMNMDVCIRISIGSSEAVAIRAKSRTRA